MIRALFLFPVILLVAGCGGASADPDAPLETYEEREVLFVDPDDLHDWIEAGHEDEVVFIDNRNAFTFEQQHIADARLIPTDQMARSIGSLPLNKWIIMYCT
ncbi:MAG TPA: rhodanese-like domain-containing protein [Gemmatimonadota bacterium]|nr:rhodanese-like domain-containing protein [Gemmatimonadota bacterium]